MIKICDTSANTLQKTNDQTLRASFATETTPLIAGKSKGK